MGPIGTLMGCTSTLLLLTEVHFNQSLASNRTYIDVLSYS